MDSSIDELISEFYKNNKLINDSLKELKFISNRNFSGKKSKTISIMSSDVRNRNKIRGSHASGILCLWDTGVSHCVISQHYVKKFQKEFRNNEMIYQTTGGNYKTKYYINIDFTLTEFSETIIINHQFHINSSKDNTFGYDMIIGQDLMKKPGMVVNFNIENLIWNSFIIPMWRDGDNFLKPTLCRARKK